MQQILFIAGIFLFIIGVGINIVYELQKWWVQQEEKEKKGVYLKMET